MVRGVANTPEAIRETQRGKQWDTVSIIMVSIAAQQAQRMHTKHNFLCQSHLHGMVSSSCPLPELSAAAVSIHKRIFHAAMLPSLHHRCMDHDRGLKEAACVMPDWPRS